MVVSSLQPFDKHLRLLFDPLTTIKIPLESILASYPEASFSRRLLGLDSGWSAEDEDRLVTLLYGTRHHRNARSPRQYAADLLLGWLLEDGILQLFQRHGITATASGSDADRFLKQGAQVTEEPDLCVTYDKERWWLDILADYPTKQGKPSFWKDTKRCHLRDNKFLRLVEYARNEDEHAGVIGIVIKEQEYFWLEITPELADEMDNPPPKGRRIRRIKTHWPYGGKPAVELKLRRLGVQYFPLTAFPQGTPFTSHLRL